MSAISASIASHLRPRRGSHARVPPKNKPKGGDAGTSALIGPSHTTLAQKPAPLVATDEIGSPDETPDIPKLRVRRVRGAGERATGDRAPILDGAQQESYLRGLLHKRKRLRISAANVGVGVGRRVEHPTADTDLDPQIASNKIPQRPSPNPHCGSRSFRHLSALVASACDPYSSPDEATPLSSRVPETKCNTGATHELGTPTAFAALRTTFPNPFPASNAAWPTTVPAVSYDYSNNYSFTNIMPICADAGSTSISSSPSCQLSSFDSGVFFTA